MLALSVPWIILLLVIGTIFFFYKKKRILASLFFIITLLLNWCCECIPYRLSYKSGYYGEDVLKVICFNIDGSTGNLQEKARNVRNFLGDYSPDIVFIAEYDDIHPNIMDSLLRDDFEFSTYYSNAMFFQYFYGNVPLINSRRLKDKDGEDVGVYTCATMLKGDTIDLFGCHFVSNNYSANHSRFSPDSIENASGLLSYLKNIEVAGQRRIVEANTLIQEKAASSHHAILMGDLNDVCGSKPLIILESYGFKDAWWEGGVGYGATISYPLPYRIDHIMYTKGLTLEKIRVIDSNGLSDHDALYAEFSFH